MEVTSWRLGAVDCTVWNKHHRTYVAFFLFERSEFLIAISQKKICVCSTTSLLLCLLLMLMLLYT